MTSPPTRTPVVFDCNVFAQALINPRGPAGRCLLLAQQGRVRLFLSDFILNELRELPAKLPVKLGVTLDRVEALIVDLAKYAEPVAKVPSLFTYARDPDDALYVSLALVSGAMLVVSRDLDLLDLMNDANEEGRTLRARFPQFRVLTPPAFLTMVTVE